MTSHSVILIDDKVLEDDDLVSQVYSTGLSLNMYSLFRAFERKKRHWLKIFEDADFKVKDIRKYTPFGDCIITVVPSKFV
jgi:hypothetical protein